MSNATLRILHLSDFHFRPKDQSDRQPVLNGLTNMLSELSTAGRAPDFVAITGDIAFSGKPEEYDLAHAWLTNHLLPSCGNLPLDRLLLVPGNHDADRELVRRGVKYVQDEILQGGQEVLSEVLGDQRDREDLFQRHQAYLEFADKFYKGKGPYWSRDFQHHGLSLGFAGLCSSFMSYQKDEQGKLLLGRGQLNEVLNPLAGTDLRIALLHHPDAYLRDFDRTESWARLRQECHLILRGHLHTEQALAVREGNDFCLELAAGCIYHDSAFPNSCHLLEYNPTASELAVSPFLWERRRWILDRNLFPDSNDGVERYHLPLKPEKQTTLSAPGPKADAKVEVTPKNRETYVDFHYTLSEQMLASASSESNGDTSEPVRLGEMPVILKHNVDGPEFLRDQGRELFQWLFPPAIRSLLDRTAAVAEKDGSKVRIRLQIENAKVAGLNLECLYEAERGRFMAVDRRTALSRYLPLPVPRNKKGRRPLHMVVVVSNPKNQQLPDKDVWGKHILAALKKPMEEGLLTLDFAANATYEGIQAALERKKPDILQFVGHGMYFEGRGYLNLENEDGSLWLAKDEILANMLAGYDDHLGLVSLLACKSGNAEKPSEFHGLAQQMIQQLGVPSVVAVKGNISYKGAEVFLRSFYDSLGRGKPIDWAMQSGRSALFRKYNQPTLEMTLPMLFMRAEDGYIFK